MKEPADLEQQELRLKTVRVEKIESGRHRQINRSYPGARRRFFRALARQRSAELRQGGLSLSQISRMRRGVGPQEGSEKWVVHHLVPRRVSGRIREPNTSENLCMMPEATHQILHAYIDPQIEGMQPGQRRTINLPSPSGPIYYAPPEQVREQLIVASSVPSSPSGRGFPSIVKWAGQLIRSRMGILLKN